MITLSVALDEPSWLPQGGGGEVICPKLSISTSTNLLVFFTNFKDGEEISKVFEKRRLLDALLLTLEACSRNTNHFQTIIGIKLEKF